MTVYLIGCGCGNENNLTLEAREAILAANLLIGAPRLLAAVPAEAHGDRVSEVYPDRIVKKLKETCGAPGAAAVLLSGDTGFYSGAKRLSAGLAEAGIPVRVLPGISSLSFLAARVGTSWEDVGIFSAHGRECDPVAAVMEGRRAFFLTGGRVTPATLCAELTEAGLGFLPVITGENLSLENERILRGTAADLAKETFAPLSVMLTEAAPRYERDVPGICDSEFIRGRVPMTKQLVRAAVMSLMDIRRGDICWDVGAGTGSVSVEMARIARRVFAIERRAEAVDLIRQNRDRFCAWNLVVREGPAPEALEGLPAPDRIFVGGSGGKLEAILRTGAEALRPGGILCVTAVTLETLGAALPLMKELFEETAAVQLAVTGTETVAGLSMLRPQSPVFILTGRKPPESGE